MNLGWVVSRCQRDRQRESAPTDASARRPYPRGSWPPYMFAKNKETLPISPGAFLQLIHRKISVLISHGLIGNRTRFPSTRISPVGRSSRSASSTLWRGQATRNETAPFSP